MEFLHQPRASGRLGDFLNDGLNGDWTHFRAAIAFVKQSGTQHVRTHLAAFAVGKSVEIIVGIDHGGTSLEGLRDLLDATGASGKVIVFHNRLWKTFHPKIYLFKSATRADLVVGSGNLTEGGIFSNYEAGLRLQLDLNIPDHSAILTAVETTLDRWSDLTAGTALVLDEPLLLKLSALGMVPTEALAASEAADAQDAGDGAIPSPADDELSNPFAAVLEPGAPASAGSGNTAAGTPQTAPLTTSPTSINGSATGFVMTLQTTDVGTGQTTAGTQRRSPEIFIPLKARDANPAFWDWPGGFTTDPNWTGPLDAAGRGKMDRANVRLRLGAETLIATIWYNPDKKDVRIRNEALRQAGAVDDILRMERADPASGFDYYVEIVPQGTTQYPVYRALCTMRPQSPNSKKRFGYY